MSKIDIANIIRRVQKLQAKTQENGCTEAEAMAAANMVGKIMNEHGLAMSDIEIRERDDCEQLDIATGRKRSHPIVWTVMAIGKFTDCKVWRDNGGQYIKFCFFGFPEDVQAANYLYHLILNAMDTALMDYKRECFSDGSPTGRSQSSAFQKGMASRIADRLRDMKLEQNRANESTGRELVVVKSATVNAEFSKLNLRLQTKTQRTGYSDREAFTAGGRAGDRVGFNKGVTGSAQRCLA